MTSGRFEGQVALVTGGGQGIGAAIATRLASEGAAVHVAEISQAGVLSAQGFAAAASVVDVSDSAAVNAWAASVLETAGRIDVLVNNAGIIRDNRIERLTDEDWKAVLDVNLSSAFFCTRAVLPFMRERSYGRIVNLSSMSWRGNFGQANYAASKAGVVGLTRTVALETARHGITVNAVAPG